MKIQAAQVERFLKSPDPRVGAVLVYGPDEGLVRERVERLVGHVLDDPNDPFRASELSADLLRNEPARLLDEANELTFTGGRRVVRVRQANEFATPACKALLGQDRIEALVILDAGDLGPTSSLRKLFESAKAAAALPCYRDQGRELGTLIDQLLADHGLRLERDARTYLIGHLGADRAITRNEIERLALYVGGPDAAPDRRITLEETAAVVGDSAALGFDDFVDAVVLGDAREALRGLDRLLGEGEHPVRIVRALANHLGRLHRLGLDLEAGSAEDEVVDRARPPIHFRRKDRVKAALRRWPPSRTSLALGRLAQAELDLKRTGSPAALICGAITLGLGRMAGRGPGPAHGA